VDETTPELRIGDRERREVDGRLQRAYADGVLTMTEYDERSAQCWAARTRRELEPLTQDLPPDHGAEPSTTAPVLQKAAAAEPVPPPPAPAARRGGRRSRVGVLAAVVLVGGVLWGGSRVATADDGAVVFGSKDVVAAAGDDTVEVGMLFGNLRVVVPPDARVHLDGGVAFGNVRCAAACDGSGSRDVVVDASGAFGNINVLRPGERLSDNDRDNDRDDNRDDDRGDNRDDDGNNG
jgi:uncharacterized protein DUF1707